MWFEGGIMIRSPLVKLVINNSHMFGNRIIYQQLSKERQKKEETLSVEQLFCFKPI